MATDEQSRVTTERNDTRLEAKVTGMVQGVGFRWWVVRAAAELGVNGWTSNEGDGSVRVVAEGTPSAIDELERRLQAGPSGARVSNVESVRLTATGEFSTFEIRSGAHRGD